MKTTKIFLQSLMFLSLFISGISYSQVLYFCESVDENGEPVNYANYFTIAQDGGYLDFLVQMDSRVGVYSVYYTIYKVKNGKEIYDNTIWQDVDPNWTWFWKEINFYENGTYDVYVYDEFGNFIATSTIEVEYR